MPLAPGSPASRASGSRTRLAAPLAALHAQHMARNRAPSLRCAAAGRAGGGEVRWMHRSQSRGPQSAPRPPPRPPPRCPSPESSPPSACAAPTTPSAGSGRRRGSPPLGPFPARPNSATHPRFAPPLPHLVLEHHDARPVPRIEVVHAQLAALRRRFLQAGIALRCERTHGPRGSGRGQRRSLVSGTHGHPTSAHPRAAVGRRRGPSRDKWRQRPLRVWSTFCKS